MTQQLSNLHPPKHRKATGITHPAVVEVAWEEGRQRMDLTEIETAAKQEDLPLGTPPTWSDISRRAGYYYRSSEVELSLTAEELYRFIRRNLEPLEHQRLVEWYGVFHEIGPEFYDMATGKALHPVYSSREKQCFVQKCLRGEESPENVQPYLQAWYADATESVPEHRHLGMTREEHKAWKADPNVLYKLLFERLRDYGCA